MEYSESELKALFQRKGREGSVSYFQDHKSTKQSVGKDEIKVSGSGKRRKKMAISVESRAAVTEPEKVYPGYPKD